MNPVVGSIAWAIAHKQCFQVIGVSKYGQIVCSQRTAMEAAECVLGKYAHYSVWVPPGTRLNVSLVTGGTIGGFHVQPSARFVVRHGMAIMV